MTVPTKPYTFSASTDAVASEVNADFDPLYNALNGALTYDNMAAAFLAWLGVSDGSNVRRGKSIIATEESRTNTAYGTLTTPDQVSSLVMPTDGLFLIGFQALIKSSVSAAGNAALFIGATQLKRTSGAGAPAVQAATTVGTSYGTVASAAGGLATEGAADSQVTTGQLISTDSAFLGGLCVVFAAAGTYTISCQVKASSGSVTMKERKMWCLAISF